MPSLTVSIHFLFKKRKKPAPISPFTDVTGFNPLPFQTKEETWKSYV
ncbi:hypothetical protein LEP1GSC041_2900 [Leptospira noguchii str. 2006001870]|nr:hypothetical protein LEP1GSC041_2900 [Leptospira noguchii str. 2006001870]